MADFNFNVEPETIDGLIAKLTKAKADSMHGGKTCVYFCVKGIDPIPCSGVKLDQDKDGAIVWLKNGQ